ncbi:MAG: hypothetical protein WBS24_10640 [Terriglobales bacterium]
MTAMKIINLLILSIILAISLFAQEAQLPPPPDVVAAPFYLDNTAHELKKLPKEPYKEHKGAPAVSFTNAFIVSAQVQGGASELRIPSQDKIVFVFDATTVPRLYKFAQSGKKREFAYQKGNQRNSTPIPGLPITVSKYKGGSAYQFSADDRLSAGEYGIVLGDSIYTFGVDEKK